jgi:cAMP-dependent protein kinase regulator
MENNERNEKNKQRLQYLETNVQPILEPLIFNITKEKPEDPVVYAINWLRKYVGKGTMNNDNAEKEELLRLRKEIKRYKEKYKDLEEDSESDSKDSENEDKLNEEEKNKYDKEVEVKMNTRKVKRKVNRSSVSAEVYGIYNKMENFKPKVFPKNDSQKKTILEKMEQNFLFKNLDKEEQNTVINAFEQRIVKTGEMVIKEGDYGDCLYLIEEGTLDCTKVIKGEKTFLKKYESGDSFGELALLYNAPRAATIVALTDSVLWKLDRECFNVIVKDSAMRKRQKYEEQLKNVEILKTLDNYDIGQICDALNSEDVESGNVIIKEGEQGNKFYILNKGEASAYKNIDGKDEKVLDYKPGSYFGELALIKNDLRAATVIADTDCNLLSLDRKSFKRLLGPLEQILTKNSELYVKYVAKNN